MSIYFNNDKVKKVYFNNTEINNCYMYSNPVFQKYEKVTPILGATIKWYDIEWLVVDVNHRTENCVYLITKDIVSKTSFGSSNVYAGSTLAQVAANFQSQLPEEALAQCVEIDVEGVTAKVFVPARLMLNGGTRPTTSTLEYFTGSDKRIAYYNGTKTNYWTSSAYSTSGKSYYINTSGSNGNASVSVNYGFRPCVCVDMNFTPPV